MCEFLVAILHFFKDLLGKSGYNRVRNRVVLVRKAELLLFEETVRGCLGGSQWEEYNNSGRSCEVTLASGLRESDKLSEPLYSPSIKAEYG